MQYIEINRQYDFGACKASAQSNIIVAIILVYIYMRIRIAIYAYAVLSQQGTQRRVLPPALALHTVPTAHTRT